MLWRTQTTEGAVTAAPIADHNKQNPACHACHAFRLSIQTALQYCGWLTSESICPVVSAIYSTLVITKSVLGLWQRITFSVREGACCL